MLDSKHQYFAFRIPALYYKPSDGQEYICSGPDNHGIHKCSGFLLDIRKFLKIFKTIADLPAYRNGSIECNLTPQEAGKFKGCVNWNMFYTNCRFYLR